MHGRTHHRPLHPSHHHHLPALRLDDRQAGPGEDLSQLRWGEWGGVQVKFIWAGLPDNF